MTELWQQAAYVHLAREAAAILGAPNDSTVAAILAQWECEQPYPAPWPPPLDNVGNLTSHVGSLDGVPHSVGRYIGGGAYLYRYADPDTGARAYANYLRNSSRYRTALAAARAGDGRTFLADVCAAGYGTRASCALSVLSRVRLAPVVAPPPAWLCLASAVNVRSGPGTNYRIVGTEHKGARVSGPVVNGGSYTAAGHHYTSWLRIGSGRYTARAFYRQA